MTHSPEFMDSMRTYLARFDDATLRAVVDGTAHLLPVDLPVDSEAKRQAISILRERTLRASELARAALIQAAFQKVDQRAIDSQKKLAAAFSLLSEVFGRQLTKEDRARVFRVLEDGDVPATTPPTTEGEPQ